MLYNKTIRSIGSILVCVFFLLTSLLFAGGQGESGNVGSGSQESVLVVGISGDIENLDPTFAAFPRSTEAIANLYDQLTTYEIVQNSEGMNIADTAAPTGLLAKEIEQSTDGKTYIFKLREGMTFWSGNEITSEDIKWSFERAANAGQGSGSFDLSVATITKPIEIIDKYTFKIHTEKTNPITLNVLAMGGLSIFDSELLKQKATSDDPYAVEWMKKNPAGSGPYILESWESGSEIVFKAFNEYWGKKSGFDKMVWRIIPSSSNRAMMVERGALDIAEGLPSKTINDLSGKDGIKVMSFPSQNQFILHMNLGYEPFDNKNVRQAVAYAVPYDDIINNVYYGNARRCDSPIPKGTPGYYVEESWVYNTDIERAKDLISTTKFKNGVEVELFIDNGKAEHETAAILIQEALKKIGMDIKIQKLNPAAFQDRKHANELQMYLDETLAWVDTPGYIFNLSWATGVYSNNINYSNKDLDKLAEEARFTIDEEKRMDMYKEAQRMLLEDCPAAFIAQPNYNLVMNENIEGFVHFFDELVRFKYLTQKSN